MMYSIRREIIRVNYYAFHYLSLIYPGRIKHH